VLPQIRKTGKYVPEGQTDTEAFKTISNEFNATTAYLLSKDYTSTSALQLADSAINKLYNVNYLEAFSLQTQL
jgi:prophage antirepressor-like protein